MSNKFAARFPKHSIVSPCRVTAQSSLVGRSGVIGAIVATVSKGVHY
jgi:hypothetical protein